MKIQTVPINKINPAPYNPRIDLKPGDVEYEKIKSSIEEFGVLQPLIWNQITGNLVGGHQRFKVLMEQGVKEVECVIVEMDEIKEKAANLALNKVQGHWDQLKLESLLSELDGVIDLDITGFNQGELDEILKVGEFKTGDISDNMINDIESLTMYLREYWDLGNEPISNMVYVLEKNGFIVTSLPTNTKKVDACSNLQVVKSEEKCIVVLGNDKRTAVRRQFDCAHELGHLIMHKWALDMETISREEYKIIEKQADQFASSFLLPKEAFLNDLIKPNKIEYYIELKKKWKVSIQAMIIRAYHLDAISYNQYQYLMRQIGFHKWRTKEPLDDEIPIPEPTALNKAVNLIINHIDSKTVFKRNKYESREDRIIVRIRKRNAI
ncbi:ImmA/IrrE family metallo-endopeptidase [Chengkuizengella axinellae]|uniref:ImmA/IrrE family metallo-endopeptidase n=1 Tax=Chengkuizengella axinellae TaxID=3064388 RepID=A0ABT9IXF5_9BACL|nr:ImmA/IrrE family metallo-endopeptidase [Chengkuizengella sp. 2205SS18-9]MDP5274010.1 ImmA/IrrE family metallo-endopeptidase [Chengkuizengella sp. 2205SS18-9]